MSHPPQTPRVLAQAGCRVPARTLDRRRVPELRPFPPVFFPPFFAQLFHFLGEVEVVFGIWLIPLAITILVMKGWSTLTGYAASIDVAEPVFVVGVMAMAGSRPVLRFAEVCLARWQVWEDQP